MKNKMPAPRWERQPKGNNGDHFFDGRATVSRGVIEKLSSDEIESIVKILMEDVACCNGLDYLQVFTNQYGDYVWCINELSKLRIESGEFTNSQLSEYNYWTMLLPDEY